MTGRDGTYTTTQLKRGDLLPELRLVSAAGTAVSVRQFRQRQPVLVALLHATPCEHCARWLRNLWSARAELEGARIASLIVRPDGESRAGPQETSMFELADPTGDVYARWLPASRGGVGLVLADRYGLCLHQWQAQFQHGSEY